MGNIAFILNSLTCGGAEKQTITLINKLNDSKKFNITLFLLKGDKHLISELNENTKVTPLNIKGFLDLKSIKIIREYCTYNNIDILFGVNMHPTMYGYLALKNFKTKIISIFHTTELVDSKAKMKNVFYRVFLNKCDKRIFVSTNQKNYWINKYNINPNNSIVIKNGVDVNKFNEKTILNEVKDNIRREYNIKESDLVISFCAMLRVEKNHMFFIESINEIVKKGMTNIKVLILGDGPEREKIERYINENNLSKNIFMLGRCKDVKSFYAISHIGVLPSKAVETFSIAALEQMSMGLPMIMSNIGGANEMIIENYNGFLFNSNNKNELKNIIEKIYKDRNRILKLKNNSRQVVEDTFTENQMVHEYIKEIIKDCGEKL